MTQAAPSLIPEAFPAVTVPSFLKAGRNLAKLSSVVFPRTYSSVLNVISSRLVLIVIGTINFS